MVPRDLQQRGGGPEVGEEPVDLQQVQRGRPERRLQGAGVLGVPGVLPVIVICSYISMRLINLTFCPA